MTYEARSKFVITSLRPAFAKIYPSSRPDLAVETFFHARPGSPLLRGITDDDFITWFDKSELASLKSRANIDNICECGRICSRDYEFRKSYESMHNNDNTFSSGNETTLLNTESTSTLISHSTIPTFISQSTLETSISEESTTEIMAEISSSTKITELTEVTSNIIPTSEGLNTSSSINLTNADILSNNVTDKLTDKPIIIPTVTYTNNFENQQTSNDLKPIYPKTNGELIIQKLPSPVNYAKKLELRKKPLPRRKGTLKATYGDKHERFFEKVRLSDVLNSSNNNITNISRSKKLVDKRTTQRLSTTNAPIFITQETDTATKKGILFTSTLDNVVKGITLSTIGSSGTTQTKTTAVPHNIAAITKSNIKTIHYRTKKPKPKTQIMKPKIYLNQSNEKHSDDNKTVKPEVFINKTKIRAILTEKYVPKPLKSINKEIHKIPPTPISETSKSLNNPPKPDIAPENRGGYEILDKNNLWELLKEGSDPNLPKINDKIQVHNRLNEVSNLTQNSNRSL